MASCLLLSRIRVHNYQPITGGIGATTERAWRSNAYWGLPDERVCGVNPVTLRASSPTPSELSRDDPDYRKWRNKEEEILRDIEPILMLTKHILHSPRYNIPMFSFLNLPLFSLSCSYTTIFFSAGTWMGKD